MTTEVETPPEGDSLAVVISATVEGDYRRRNVFPEIRAELGRPYPGRRDWWSFTVPRALAEALWKDARDRYGRQSPRGVSKALNTLDAYLGSLLSPPAASRAAVPQADAITPGELSAYRMLRRRLGPNVDPFKVGEVALLWFPGTGDHRIKVEIHAAYGPHWIRNGKRDEVLWGYLVRELGANPTFVFPYQLRRCDGTIAHLRAA